MSGTVQHSKIETRTSRARLAKKREPFWRALIVGKAHLGWQQNQSPKGSSIPGRWLLRRYIDGKYTQATLGTADDSAEANGDTVLSFEQAEAKARALLDRPAVILSRYTVRTAVADYTDYLHEQGKTGSAKDVACRLSAHVLPLLGDVAISDLTTERLRRWRSVLAALPAMKRTPRGAAQAYRPEPTDEEGIRKRQASAGRVWSMLRSALNHAFRHGKVSSDTAWRRVAPIRGVNVPRSRYLNLSECERLLNACAPEFRPLMRAALETGARYSELCRLQVDDFNVDSGGTLHIRRSKTARSRHIILTPEAAQWFAQHCAGRSGLMFTRANGQPWTMSLQARPMKLACINGRIVPEVTFHGLRHTYASLAIMAGMPALVLSRNLGHVDATQVQSTYGHLAPDYVSEQVRRYAPRFPGGSDGKIVPLK